MPVGTRPHNLALTFLWFDEALMYRPVTALPARGFPGAATAAVRTDFTPGSGLYLGFRGGVSARQHRQEENGTFVLTSATHRWVMDPGQRDYSMPAMPDFYYRQLPRGSNTLVIDGRSQVNEAVSPLVKLEERGNTHYGVVDLLEAYQRVHSGQTQLRSLHRGYAVNTSRDSFVLIKDSVRVLAGWETAQGTTDVEWRAHTRADIELSANGQVAQLTLGNAMMKVFSARPFRGGHSFQVQNAPVPPDPTVSDRVRFSLDGVQILSIHANVARGREIEVYFVPEGSTLFALDDPEMLRAAVLAHSDNAAAGRPVADW